MAEHILRLFDAFGIEIEHMIVDRGTLVVKPVADELLMALAGEPVAELELGDISWSNELALHVIEFKTNGPSPVLSGLAGRFAAHVQRANALLAELDAMLMPTGAHPLMDPMTETRLWPHEYGPVYDAYDRIFGCRGHGWSNLQSTHINLPFHGDNEFGRLHAAIRLLLPIMPGLTASTPILDGHVTGFMDSRMEVYRHNSMRISSVAGSIIPEQAYTRKEYDKLILAPMYRDIAPLDPEGVLQDEFLNSRGAIARFGRGAIEIRVLDTQECPAADLAAAGLITAVVKGLVDEAWIDAGAQKQLPVGGLAAIFRQVIRHGHACRINDALYLRCLGMPSTGQHSVQEIWQHLYERCLAGQTADCDPAWEAPLKCILDQGPLACRILNSLDRQPDRAAIEGVYRRLCDCLEQGGMFDGHV